MARASTRRPQNAMTPGVMGRVNPVVFMREVFSELQKSVWPSREEVARLTAVVIALAAAIGVFLGVVDRLFGEILNRFVF